MKSFMGITEWFGEISQIDTYIWEGYSDTNWSKGMTTLTPPVIPSGAYTGGTSWNGEHMTEMMAFIFPIR